MRHFPHIYHEYEIFFIAERSTSEEYRSESEQPELSNDEIATIRTALQRITRRRIMNANDAEDLVQETLLTMITSQPGGELKKGLLVWCQGILRNKVGNYYRKAKRHDSFKEQQSAMQQDPVSPVVASPEITASNRELRSIIKEKLAEFPPDIRCVMELLVSGLEAGEIADQLSPEPYQNVINRLYRGRKRLARELVKCGFGPNRRVSPNYRKGRNQERDVENPTGISRKVS